MPILWPHLFLLIPAIPLACEDFLTRRVSVWWLFVTGGMAFSAAWIAHGLHQTLLCLIVNSSILLFIGAVISVFMLVRRKSLLSGLGAGDIVMLLALTPLLMPTFYVYYLLTGCVVALIWWCIKRPTTIPLVSFLSLTLIVYCICKTCKLWS